MQAAATQPHGHLIPFATKNPSGCLMRARNTTGHNLGRGIHVGDIFLSLPVDGTSQETTTTATDYTKEGSAMLDETGVRGVIQTPPPEIGVTTDSLQAKTMNFARAFVVLPSASSTVKPAHGMESAAYVTVSTAEQLPGDTSARLAAIDSDVRATCGRALVYAKVKLGSGVTALIAGTPLIVYGTTMCTLASAVEGAVGARVVGYLAKAISGAAAATTVLALVDFDGDHGFGMVTVDPTP